MKVLVLGGSGMLGHQLCRRLPRQMEVWASFRGEAANDQYLDFFGSIHAIAGVAVEDLRSVEEALDGVRPAAVVNAVGIVKQRDEANQAIPSIRVNSLFPHQLADLCQARGIRLVQISTDCVFSGLRGHYAESDLPDPVDLYGRTKLIGELNRANCLTLRTSIIGWELKSRSSLLEWFAAQRGRHIKGYRKAIYSGFSTSVLATLIGDLLETRPDVTGLFHVASEPISKCELLQRLGEALGWDDILIDPDDQFHCDRSLIGRRFEAVTGWGAPGWDEMIAGVAAEWPIYAELRGSQQVTAR
jgi:dTDP-4-dehydrorhamnose reductase